MSQLFRAETGAGSLSDWRRGLTPTKPSDRRRYQEDAPTPILRQWPDNLDSTCPVFSNTLSSEATTVYPAFSMTPIDDVT
jgi:hypothetical protein